MEAQRLLPSGEIQIEDDSFEDEWSGSDQGSEGSSYTTYSDSDSDRYFF